MQRVKVGIIIALTVLLAFCALYHGARAPIASVARVIGTIGIVAVLPIMASLLESRTAKIIIVAGFVAFMVAVAADPIVREGFNLISTYVGEVLIPTAVIIAAVKILK